MKLIHPLIIARIISLILIIGSTALLSNVPVAIIYNEPLYPFILSTLIAGIPGIAGRILTKKANIKKASNRDGYISVTSAWIVLSLLSTLPYIIGGAIPSFVDAFYEAASGLTTTGASILSNIEILPKSILFWRSMTHWIGGFGIILLVIIILPSLRITAQQLMNLESSLKEKVLPKTKSIVLRLLFVYLALTVAETFLLSLGEMDLFDSICHSFSTVATGGFSTFNDSLASCSEYTQNVIMVFMFLSGVSFILYYLLVKGRFRKVMANEEFWFYFGVVAVVGFLLGSTIIDEPGMGFRKAFEESYFQVISIVTTTGFATVDYIHWPHSAITVLFILMFTGACTGSTTGGIKMARHLVILKNISNLFRQLNHSKSIQLIKVNGNVISEKRNLSILTFTLFYLLVFFIGSGVTIITGIDPVTAVSSTISSLGNVGPAMGTAGPMVGYSHFPDITKLFHSFLMIIGRLELMTVFVIFTKPFWKI